MTPTRRAIGVDVGGTAVKAVLADGAGQVLRASMVSADNDRARLLSAIRGLVDDLRDGSDVALGVATPGIVDPAGRRTLYCPGKLDIEGVDWQEALRWDGPVPVLNDANAALLGECWTGAGRGLSHVVLLTLGTGVGGAVLSDGRLLRGARGRAGHLGHISVSDDPTRGIVGTPGTLEDAIGEQTVTRRTGGRVTSTAALVEAVQRGEPWAEAAWDRAVRTLARSIASLVNVFDPEAIIVGGGIAQAGGALFDRLAGYLALDEWRPDGTGVPVRPAALGARAGALGAARQALSGGDAFR